MQKFKFSNSIVVEVSKSPLDKPERGNPYTIYQCYCRPFGRGQKKGTRAKYQVTATTAAQAARFAAEMYRRDTGFYKQD